MDKLEDELNKILDDGLKLMPLMKGISNNYLSILDLGNKMNTEINDAYKLVIRKAFNLKELTKVIKREPNETI